MMFYGNERIVLVSGARTPVGKYGGSLAGTDNHLLGAHAFSAAVERAGLSAPDIDEVIVGCVGQVGGDAFLARRISLEAGARLDSTAMTVNRLCGSGLQALHSGAMELMRGDANLVVAGGSENMSRQPFMDFNARNGWRLGDHTLVDGTMSLVTDPFSGGPMGLTAEKVAREFGISRADQDDFACESQRRAAAAQEAGLFVDEITPITVRQGKNEVVFEADEHLRPQTNIESLQRLRPAFLKDEEASVTAGNSSGINDAAAMLVMTTERYAKEKGLPILGEFVDFVKTGVHPDIMGYAPRYAIEQLMDRHSMSVADMDWIELNEAFAAQALAVIRDAKLDPEKTNPLGGAIALGHPVGATGAILTLRALLGLRRTRGEHALVTMCIGGGQAVAALIRAL